MDIMAHEKFICVIIKEHVKKTKNMTLSELGQILQLRKYVWTNKVFLAKKISISFSSSYPLYNIVVLLPQAFHGHG